MIRTLLAIALVTVFLYLAGCDTTKVERHDHTNTQTTSEPQMLVQ